MRKLLLVAALLPALAAAQNPEWTLDSTIDLSEVYGSGTAATSGIHGLAVDGDGRLWVQNHFATEPTTRNGDAINTRALYVFNDDGTQAACSPILFLKDDAGTVVDTLGLYTTDTGALDTRTGRGLTSTPDGDILVSQFDVLYLLDPTSCTEDNTNSIVQLARTQPSPGNSLTAASADENGNIFVTAVLGGGVPIFSYTYSDTAGEFEQGNNVYPNGYAIGRDIQATSDGLAVIAHAFTAPGAVLHYRPDLFTPFDSVGVTLRGLATESSTRDPRTGYLWFSAGKAGAINANEDPVVTTNYQNQAWYAYLPEDLYTVDGSGVATAVENPTPRDSIVVEDWADDLVGPRGIAFDGLTAYVANFGAEATASIKVFTRPSGTDVTSGPEDLFRLTQNRPNPFSDATDISFSLAEAGHVTLRVYDQVGREVATVTDAPYSVGDHTVTFRANGLAAGVYVYRLDVDGRGTSRRMAIVR